MKHLNPVELLLMGLSMAFMLATLFIFLFAQWSVGVNGVSWLVSAPADPRVIINLIALGLELVCIVFNFIIKFAEIDNFKIICPIVLIVYSVVYLVMLFVIGFDASIGVMVLVCNGCILLCGVFCLLFAIFCDPYDDFEGFGGNFYITKFQLIMLGAFVALFVAACSLMFAGGMWAEGISGGTVFSQMFMNGGALAALGPVWTAGAAFEAMLLFGGIIVLAVNLFDCKVSIKPARFIVSIVYGLIALGYLILLITAWAMPYGLLPPAFQLPAAVLFLGAAVVSAFFAEPGFSINFHLPHFGGSGGRSRGGRRRRLDGMALAKFKDAIKITIILAIYVGALCVFLCMPVGFGLTGAQLLGFPPIAFDFTKLGLITVGALVAFSVCAVFIFAMYLHNFKWGRTPWLFKRNTGILSLVVSLAFAALTLVAPVMAGFENFGYMYASISAGILFVAVLSGYLLTCHTRSKKREKSVEQPKEEPKKEEAATPAQASNASGSAAKTATPAATGGAKMTAKESASQPARDAEPAEKKEQKEEKEQKPAKEVVTHSKFDDMLETAIKREFTKFSFSLKYDVDKSYETGRKCYVIEVYYSSLSDVKDWLGYSAPSNTGRASLDREYHTSGADRIAKAEDWRLARHVAYNYADIDYEHDLISGAKQQLKNIVSPIFREINGKYAIADEYYFKEGAFLGIFGGKKVKRVIRGFDGWSYKIRFKKTKW